MKIDQEFKNLIPPLTAEEYAQLEQNCLDYGIRDSLVITALPGESDTVLIDGHNRFEIAQKNNLSYNVRRLDFKDRDAIKEWIIKNQLGRRNVPAYVRAELALKLKPVIAAKAKERQGTRTDKGNIVQNSARSRDELAKAAGVSHDTIHKVEKIQQKAPEEVKEALRKGEMSINQAYQIVDPPKSVQQSMREFKRQAREEHKKFEQTSKEDVVDIQEVKRDKTNLEIIALDVNITISRALSSVATIGMIKEKEFDIMVDHLKPQAKRDMINSVQNGIRTLTHLSRILSEGRKR